MTAPSARVTTEWLALRGPADVRARDLGGSVLADLLSGHLASRRGGRPARLVDVGAGTGAGAAWLRGRLGVPQHWRLIDHDAGLLDAAPPVREGWTEPVVVDLDRLDALLDTEPADAVTCQALLDLLRPTDVRALVQAAVGHGAAVLASLTVTGEVRISPSDPADALVGEAFNAHQRRGGRLGPDAAAFTTDVLISMGYRVTSASTPWCLGAESAPLMRQWLIGRAAAAVEQQPADRVRVERWLEARLALGARGGLTAVVEHRDVLGLPAPVVDPGNGH